MSYNSASSTRIFSLRCGGLVELGVACKNEEIVNKATIGRKTETGWLCLPHRGWTCATCYRRIVEERLAAKIYRRLYPKPRGFAAMPPEAQRALAAKGGRKAHALGTAYEWNSEAAQRAGRRGGIVTGEERRARRLAAS